MDGAGMGAPHDQTDAEIISALKQRMEKMDTPFEGKMLEFAVPHSDPYGLNEWVPADTGAQRPMSPPAPKGLPTLTAAMEAEPAPALSGERDYGSLLNPKFQPERFFIHSADGVESRATSRIGKKTTLQFGVVMGPETRFIGKNGYIMTLLTMEEFERVPFEYKEQLPDIAPVRMFRTVFGALNRIPWQRRKRAHISKMIDVLRYEGGAPCIIDKSRFATSDGINFLVVNILLYKVGPPKGAEVTKANRDMNITGTLVFNVDPLPQSDAPETQATEKPAPQKMIIATIGSSVPDLAIAGTLANFFIEIVPLSSLAVSRAMQAISPDI